MDELSPEVLELAHAMLEAARNGDSDVLVPLLDQGAPIDLRDSRGNSLVMLAAYHGHAALVAELASRGADLDLLNERGQSPLSGAVFKADHATVKVLADAGADPDLGTPSARDTAEYFAVEGMAELLGQP